MTGGKPWKEWQAQTLRKMIIGMMKVYGYVDMGMVSNHVNHSIDSCHAKAANMDLRYTTKKKVPYMPIKPLKGDMKNLPRHRNGKDVHYV